MKDPTGEYWPKANREADEPVSEEEAKEAGLHPIDINPNSDDALGPIPADDEGESRPFRLPQE